LCKSRGTAGHSLRLTSGGGAESSQVSNTFEAKLLGRGSDRVESNYEAPVLKR
jgi:hypothetical protein